MRLCQQSSSDIVRMTSLMQCQGKMLGLGVDSSQDASICNLSYGAAKHSIADPLPPSLP